MHKATYVGGGTRDMYSETAWLSETQVWLLANTWEVCHLKIDLYKEAEQCFDHTFFLPHFFRQREPFDFVHQNMVLIQKQLANL